MMPDAPWLAGYREFLRSLGAEPFPPIRRLNEILPEAVVSGGGIPIRFRAAVELPGIEYERHIFETGEVSTRENDWHDLFNALAWCRWRRLKSAMNALHCRAGDKHQDGRRGARRDALTLLDESGALVVSAERELLQALAGHDWRRAFVGLRSAWEASACLVCGHALLDKLRSPYKAVTAHVLLLHGATADAPFAGEDFQQALDARLGDALLAGSVLETPADLSPLPLAGIPGWWRQHPQDEAFYADRAVFRASSGRRGLAPIRSAGRPGGPLLY